MNLVKKLRDWFLDYMDELKNEAAAAR